ncbi:hypothetical protein MUK42_33754 [Musa troglodytarum]|uniref:Uncharacterized protein n=1 Tax=Musa troglodytarum TaxID=320322 RepID=A0A9E7EFD9_9LILI|nr:hypothetical protein MUK42_33754 [Musa troglodytarum]
MASAAVICDDGQNQTNNHAKISEFHETIIGDTAAGGRPAGEKPMHGSTCIAVLHVDFPSEDEVGKSRESCGAPEMTDSHVDTIADVSVCMKSVKDEITSENGAKMAICAMVLHVGGVH